MRLEPVLTTGNDLGEVPLWCARSQRLWWTDIRACRLHTLTPSGGIHDVYPMPDWIGALAFYGDDGEALLLAARKSLLRFDIATQTFRVLQTFEDGLPSNRSNDGRCDREGRFWIGTLNNADRVPSGNLYCFDGERFERRLDDIIVPNSLAWSPDSRVMYFTDSWRGDVWAYDFDADSGAISNRRVLLAKDALPGIPDGSAVDADGCLWQVRYGAGQLARITPDGRVDRVVQSDTLQLTACTFGGSDFRDLYVTSARQRMTQQQLDEQPQAGSLFVLRTDVAGLPEPAFAPGPDAR